MKEIICSRCGANKWISKNGFRVCEYCGTKFEITKADFEVKGSGMDLDNDIGVLLLKCKQDPKNAKKYANLILDIDPENEEAIKYLR